MSKRWCWNCNDFHKSKNGCPNLSSASITENALAKINDGWREELIEQQQEYEKLLKKLSDQKEYNNDLIAILQDMNENDKTVSRARHGAITMLIKKIKELEADNKRMSDFLHTIDPWNGE